MKTLNLNTSPALPESSANQTGATENSMGRASLGDLKDGFYKCDEPTSPFDDNTLQYALRDNEHGFLNRPHGLER